MQFTNSDQAMRRLWLSYIYENNSIFHSYRFNLKHEARPHIAPLLQQLVRICQTKNKKSEIAASQAICDSVSAVQANLSLELAIQSFDI
jgi:hypothetical protein